MHIDWWTLGLQTVNVLVLLFILSRFFFRPLSAMIAARRDTVIAELEAARSAREAAAAEHRRIVAEGEALAGQRAGLARAAAEEAAKEKESLIAAARAEVQAMRTAAAADLAQEREAGRLAEADRASTLAVDIAAKLCARLPQEALVAGFIAGLAEAVAGLPEATRAQMASAPLALSAPRPLMRDETKACEAALARALGAPVTVSMTVDPGLIAGLELAAPHAVVRNSLRADLDRIAGELTRHDR